LPYKPDLAAGMRKLNIMVLCTGNSCRSQIAEGYLRYFARNKANIYSAGIEAHGVNPRAVAVMKMDGIDITGHTSNLVGEYKDISFDYVITVCDHAKESCPFLSSRIKTVHHNFPDPARAKGPETEVLEKFIEVRDSIKQFCRTFIDENLSLKK